jgi:hypothetical protein
VVRETQAALRLARRIRDLDEARAAIAGYVDAYPHRAHQGLAYRTPAEVART